MHQKSDWSHPHQAIAGFTFGRGPGPPPALFPPNLVPQFHQSILIGRHVLQVQWILVIGVIDERLDLALIEGIADQRPDWHIVMAGPIVKIDPATLPRRRNIYWIGMQRYEALPHLLSHWDVCLLPFALNEATRFISPTKTLEYLAGGKPAVSTPIHDVVSLYGSVVRIGATADEFVVAIEQTLAESPARHAAWRIAAQAMVDSCAWDSTAARIAALLNRYVHAGSAEPIVLAEPLVATRLPVAAKPDADAALPQLGERREPAAQPSAQ